jgi:hypothetical protein
MADDTSIDIGFTVGTESLESGLSEAGKQVGDACATIKAALDQVRTSAIEADRPLKAMGDKKEGSKAAGAIAEETQQVEILKALHRISADDAIREQLRIEDAHFESLRNQLEAEKNANSMKAGEEEKFQARVQQLELQHDSKRRALQVQAVRESQASWSSILAPVSSAFQSSLNGILQGNETLGQAMAKMEQSIVTQFADMAVKRATDWIASELTMNAATEAGEAIRLSAKQTGAVAGKAADAAAGSASVFGDANKAAAGAYASTADIPVVGPILAPIAAGTAFAAVMAFDIFSAAGGWDIPAGLNPITQLHQREMVLPAGPAETLRGLANGTPPGGDIHHHFSPTIPISYVGKIDAGGIQNLQTHVVAALRKAHRELALV